MCLGCVRVLPVAHLEDLGKLRECEVIRLYDAATTVDAFIAVANVAVETPAVLILGLTDFLYQHETATSAGDFRPQNVQMLKVSDSMTGLKDDGRYHGLLSLLNLFLDLWLFRHLNICILA